MKSLCSVLGVCRGLQGAVSVKGTRKVKMDRGRKKEWIARSSDRKVWKKRKTKIDRKRERKKESSG